MKSTVFLNMVQGETLRNMRVGARKMAQQLSVPAVLAEDPGSVPITYMVANNHP